MSLMEDLLRRGLVQRNASMTGNPPRPPGTVPGFSMEGLNIRPAYAPGQTFGRTATMNAKPFSAIVSHWTGTPNLQSALNTLKGDPGRGGSSFGYHFYIDRDGSVHQGAPLDARTNHVRGPDPFGTGKGPRTSRPEITNENAIGISMVGQGKPTLEQLQSGYKLMQGLQKQYNIPLENVVGHGQIQGDRQSDEGMGLINYALSLQDGGGAVPRAAQQAGPAATVRLPPASGSSDPANVMTRLREAIGQVESAGSGGYQAVGKETRYGRGIGKYQVLEANVPQWTREALGRSMTPEQFLNNRVAQDKVADFKLGQYAKKFGVEGAAKAWGAGPGNARDQTSPKISQYWNRVNNVMQADERGGAGTVASQAVTQPPPAVAPAAPTIADQPGPQAIKAAIQQPAAAAPAEPAGLAGFPKLAGVGAAGALGEQQAGPSPAYNAPFADMGTRPQTPGIPRDIAHIVNPQLTQPAAAPWEPPAGAVPPWPGERQPTKLTVNKPSAPAPAAAAAPRSAPPAQASRPPAAPAAAPAGSPGAARGRSALAQGIIDGYGPAGRDLTTFVEPATGNEVITGSVGGDSYYKNLGRTGAGQPAQGPVAAPAALRQAVEKAVPMPRPRPPEADPYRPRAPSMDPNDIGGPLMFDFDPTETTHRGVRPAVDDNVSSAVRRIEQAPTIAPSPNPSLGPRAPVPGFTQAPPIAGSPFSQAAPSFAGPSGSPMPQRGPQTIPGVAAQPLPTTGQAAPAFQPQQMQLPQQSLQNVPWWLLPQNQGAGAPWGGGFGMGGLGDSLGGSMFGGLGGFGGGFGGVG